MDCLPVATLPEGAVWTWEIKLDGWRMEAVKTGGRVTLYSRRGKNFNAQFGQIARELEYLPDETVIDGEMVAVDEEGRPSFNLLQNFRSEESRIVYYVFDIRIHNGNDLMQRPLSERREVLRSVIRAGGHVGISEASDRPLAEMLSFTQTHGLEGIVAKRADSRYQPGLRTGAWSKHRLNRSQEFVIGGYVPSDLGIDSLVVGVYQGRKSILRSASASRIHSCHSAASLRSNQTPDLNEVPIREPAGKRAGKMGTGADSREDAGVHLAQAGSRCGNPVSGVDGSGSPASHEIHSAAR
jgi:bifunctional non-homologous end joining protein LigD